MTEPGQGISGIDRGGHHGRAEALQSDRRLWRAAETLGRRRRQGKGLPVVWMVTDPDRLPDPVRAAEGLPPGAGVILRHFGRPEAVRWAEALAEVALRRRLVLLIGADPELAAAVGAAGVHVPERMTHRAPELAARFAIVTAAAHSARAARRALSSGADAVLLSPILPSRSPSAGAPLGPVRFALAVRSIPGPVFALGGIGAATAGRLVDTGAAGFAAVEAFSGPADRRPSSA